MALLAALILPCSSFGPAAQRRRAVRRRASPAVAPEPSEAESRFGRRSYWDGVYADEAEFSWYCGWADVEPLWLELVPGVGNDDAAVGLVDAGFTSVAASDYAPEGVARARARLGDERAERVDLRVADARSLPYGDDAFDAVFEKGTLDAVFLSGGRDKALAYDQLRLCAAEMARTVRRGGVVLSLSAPATEPIDRAFRECRSDGGGARCWRQLIDGDSFVTDDGFASINVDATILAWERL